MEKFKWNQKLGPYIVEITFPRNHAKNIFYTYRQYFYDLRILFYRLSLMRKCYQKIITFFLLSEGSELSSNSIVTTSRSFVGGQEAAVETRNGVTVPSPRHVGYTGALTHRGCAPSPMEFRSVPRKQFGPRKLHQSARGADSLKAVTFLADVTGSYFTRSVPTPSCSSSIRLSHLPTHPRRLSISLSFSPIIISSRIAFVTKTKEREHRS